MSLSQITLSGTIKSDAEQKTIPSGNTVTSFIMNVLRYDNRAKEEKSYPVKVNMWGDTFADQAGQLVTGKLQIDQFNDRNGKMIRIAAIDANRVAPLKDLLTANTAAATMMADPYAGEGANFTGSETDALTTEEVPF
jgi:single-stranded DNA-binding protein